MFGELVDFGRELEIGAVFEGGGESDLVGVGEVNAEREPAGKASDFYVRVLLVESFLEKKGGRFPLDGGISGNDNFLYFVRLDTVQ